MAGLKAQHLYFSNIPRLNNKAYYNKVIGENPNGIYVLRFRDIELRSGFSIEKYSHRLDFSESQNFQLGKRERLLKVFTTDSGLFLIKTGRDKSKTFFACTRTIGTTLQPRPADRFYETDKAEKLSDNTVIEYSPNRSWCAMWMEEVNEQGNQVFTCVLLKSNGELKGIWHTSTKFPFRDAELQQVAVSDSGATAATFLLIRPEKRSTEPAAEEHFLMQCDGKKMFNPLSVGDNHYFLSSYDLVYNQYRNQFYLAGFFDFKKPESAHGWLDWRFVPSDTMPEPKLSPIDRQFVAGMVGAKEAESGEDPQHFFVRRIVPRSDGGFLLVAEYFDITQQMETFYLNGAPQVSSKNVYNYNDIMLISVDEAGNAEWNHLINKRQSSYASLSYLHSIGVYVCESNVNIVYNDNSNQNNRVMHISVGKDGVIEQKIILNSDNEYTALIPAEGKQTGYNRYVAPLIQSRQISLLQLVDQH